MRTIWFDSLWRDVHHAWRTLLRSRAFTITALVVLALGIGVNTTVYTVVRGIAFRPLPFDDAERLMFIGELSPLAAASPWHRRTSVLTLRSVRQGLTSE
jgi:hypothetical protein